MRMRVPFDADSAVMLTTATTLTTPTKKEDEVVHDNTRRTATIKTRSPLSTVVLCRTFVWVSRLHMCCRVNHSESYMLSDAMCVKYEWSWGMLLLCVDCLSGVDNCVRVVLCVYGRLSACVYTSLSVWCNKRLIITSLYDCAFDEGLGCSIDIISLFGEFVCSA